MHPAVVPLLAVAIAALTASNVVWLTGVPLPSFTADSHGAVHGGSAGQHGAPASRGGDDGAGDAGNADDPVRMGARRLQAVYSPSSELPAASAMWGSWSQVVAGTPESYYAEELVKPQHRFAHSATAVPMLKRGFEGTDRVVLFGGYEAGPRSDLWFFEPGVHNLSTARLVSGNRDAEPNSRCDENGRCVRWYPVTAQVEVQECSPSASQPTGAQCSVASAPLCSAMPHLVRIGVNTLPRPDRADLKAPDGTALPCAVPEPLQPLADATNAVLARYDHASTLLYRDVDSAQDTALLAVFGGRDRDQEKADLWLLELSTLTWRLISNGSAWQWDNDRFFHDVLFGEAEIGYADPDDDTVFPPVANLSAVDGMPSPRSGFAMASLRAQTRSVVAQQFVDLDMRTMRATAGQFETFALVLADRLEYAEEYNLGNDTFPFVFTSTAPIEALHPRLCTDSVGCPPKRWELTAESLRVWPASYTNVSGWGAEEPLSTWSVLRNETISGYFFVNATANQTQLVVQNNTFLISTAASSGVTRLLLFGGRQGRELRSDVWAFDYQQQLTSFVWDEEKLRDITFDAPGIQPNYNPNVHIHYPRLPTLSRWRRVATRGDPPPPRFGHTAVVTGAPGGLGAQRHALLVFGGRGTTGPLNDAWELSLEGVPPYQPEVQALVCHTATAGAPLQGEFTLLLGAGGPETVALSPNATAAQLRQALQALPDVHRVAITMPRRVVAGAAPTTLPVAAICGNGPVLITLETDARTHANASRDSFPLLVPGNASTALAVQVSRVQRLQLSEVAAYTWTRVFTTQAEREGVPYTQTTEARTRTGIFGRTQLEDVPQPQAVADDSMRRTPAPRVQHSAAMVQRADGQGRSMLVQGGWDGVRPRSDAWMLTLGEAVGNGTWEKLLPARGGGRWLFCTAKFFPVSWYGTRCANESESGYPERYWHTAVPTVTSVAEDGSTSEAVLLMGGLTADRIAEGNNSDAFRWANGGRNPDLYYLCTNADGSSNRMCAGGLWVGSAAPLLPRASSIGAALAWASAAALALCATWQGMRRV